VISSESLPNDDQAIVVQVTWATGRDVQLSTVLVNSATRETVTMSVDDGEDGWEFDGGWYATINRRQINELIRALRRARDQAFGRDE